VTRHLGTDEIRDRYERNTGRVIAERFAGQLDPMEIPAVLVAGHGPFVWGATVREAVENAVALELIAEMALRTSLLEPGVAAIPSDLLDKHFFRKHGPDAYYGQRADRRTLSQ
jgi:L-ribulose-5-phosphate 4-epimerase